MSPSRSRRRPLEVSFSWLGPLLVLSAQFRSGSSFSGTTAVIVIVVVVAAAAAALGYVSPCNFQGTRTFHARQSIPAALASSHHHNEPRTHDKDGRVYKVADASDVLPHPLPSWATRKWNAIQPPRWHGSTPMPIVACLSDDECHVTIVNEERTWEDFVALVILSDQPINGAVSPACGSLAPRGGCINLCHVDSEIYDDMCTFHLHWKEILSTQSSATSCHLLVMTE